MLAPPVAAIADSPPTLAALAAEIGCGYVAEVPEQIPSEALASVPGWVAHRYGVMPLRADPAGIDVLLSDPRDTRPFDELDFVLGRSVRIHLADPAKVQVQIRRHYGEADFDVSRMLEPQGRDTSDDAAVPAFGAVDRNGDGEEIVSFVDSILRRAISDQASDIHFEPFEHEFKIRCRVDGLLQELPPARKDIALAVTSRIKVLANLNIAERRMAQDGRIRLQHDRRSVDLRVSTLPTQFGESVVVRILDQGAVRLELAELGMPRDVLSGITGVLRRPGGILIVTGPTGSGKTTTLYSALRFINSPELKLLTVEDPVEYEIDGIMQVPVNPAAGLDFATALRSFLRQDPDIVMVGEIRDIETAQIAIQAALTGHLVLTTLHTNDAAGAITRLIDMGVEPFLVASTVEAVLAQRLVRRVCSRCAKPVAIDPVQLESLEAHAAEGKFEPLQGSGCPACGESGYRGRAGIYEFLRVTDELRDLIAQREPTQRLRQKASEQGMRSLRQEGIRAIAAGDTTLEEILKFT